MNPSESTVVRPHRFCQTPVAAGDRAPGTRARETPGLPMTARRIPAFIAAHQASPSLRRAEISHSELVSALDITECLRLLAVGLGPARIAR